MKRGGNLKRSRMKPGRRNPRPSLDAFADAVLAGQFCAICQDAPATDPHHFIAKARLKDMPDAYVDPRNGVPLCGFCHANVTNGRLHCPRPPEFWAFITDHGLLESGRPDPSRREAA